VLAHIGRPSLRAIDAGLPLPFGEWGTEGTTYAYHAGKWRPPRRSEFR
jgi:hypothetical protein